MRRPAVAGRFYPSGEEALRASIRACFADRLGEGLPGSGGNAGEIRGAMVPHAGYMASGANASRVYKRIGEDGPPEAYVIIGPDHWGTHPGNSFSSESYGTPLGECPVHGGICEKLAGYLPDLPDAQAFEHSIEVQVPFLQFVDPGARIVPVLMGDQTPESARRLAEILRRACEGFDIVYIASSDMSHYVPKKTAERLDSAVLEKIGAMDVRGMYRTVAENRVSMCGYGPVATVMSLCSGCSCEIIAHTDSFDSLGADSDSVVGYGTALFRRRKK